MNAKNTENLPQRVSIENRECLGKVTIDRDLYDFATKIGMIDSSWHNDNSPSMELDFTGYGEEHIKLWINYDLEVDQEFNEGKYTLIYGCPYEEETLYQGDSAEKCLDELRKLWETTI